MFSRLFLFLCSFKRVFFFFFSFYNVYLTLPVFSVTKSGTSGFQRFYSRPSRPVCQQVIEECFKVVHRNHSESQDTLWAVVWQHVIWNLQERSPQCMACLLLILTVSFSFWMESPMVPDVQWEWGTSSFWAVRTVQEHPWPGGPSRFGVGAVEGKSSCHPPSYSAQNECPRGSEVAHKWGASTQPREWVLVRGPPCPVGGDGSWCSSSGEQSGVSSANWKQSYYMDPATPILVYTQKTLYFEKIYPPPVHSSTIYNNLDMETT